MIESNSTSINVENWDSYAESSEIWVFQGNREFDENEITEIKNLAHKFISNWNSHGVKVEGDYKIFHNQFIVFLADKANSPSGCSKDSMIHFVEGLGKKYSIDFFDRMSVAFLNGKNEVQLCHLHEMSDKIKDGAMSKETVVFNNLVNTKKEFVENWKVSIQDSWHANFA